ncbi:MAG: hypothetical protein U0519_05235 [Candidatus Gracilibacteria bacterium]
MKNSSCGGAAGRILKQYSKNIDLKRLQAISRMVMFMIHDLCRTSGGKHRQSPAQNGERCRNHEGKIVIRQEHQAGTQKELRQFLMERASITIQRSPSNRTWQNFSKNFFCITIKKPQQLQGPLVICKTGEAKEIVVKDYIAGMTDHYAEKVGAEL